MLDLAVEPEIVGQAHDLAVDASTDEAAFRRRIYPWEA
jgi:hypothetical protein